MSLTLYFHPLASYCWKPLIALYENDTNFTPIIVNLGDETSRIDFLKIWPMGEFPVLRDEGRSRTIPGSSAIVEYLRVYSKGGVPMIPEDSRGFRFGTRSASNGRIHGQLHPNTDAKDRRRLFKVRRRERSHRSDRSSPDSANGLRHLGKKRGRQDMGGG